ncbi:CDP-alcohol phosphatidyltransferase family protein [Ruthenibacterium lactatiformans]|uniref:CDP-alcohol phosphatidyltransferase family protein n=1 Tax=Ruthenibacterium lactatiformans TaxID=1550024 RepID=UPI003AB621A3
MKTKVKNDPKIFTIPNILSFFRLCLIPFIIWLYCVEQNYIWAGNVLILSGLTDIVDGFIARRFHMTSDLGKILDPVADKLTQAAMLLCLMLRFRLMIIPLVLMLAKETFMSVTGFMIIQKSGTVCGANWHGKVATCFLYAMMILHVFWHEITPAASTLLIIACAIMILVSFVLYGIRNMKALK